MIDMLILISQMLSEELFFKHVPLGWQNLWQSLYKYIPWKNNHVENSKWMEEECKFQHVAATKFLIHYADIF